MLQNIFIAVIIFLISSVSTYVLGQTPASAIKPMTMAGNVSSINAKSIGITSKTGQMEAALTEKTAYKRVSPEPFKPLNFLGATAGVFTDIGVGDIVTVSALLAADGKSMNARTVYYVTKADIEAKNGKEAAEWQKRGITGKVASVNEQTNQIVVEMRSLTGSSNITLTPKENAKFLRYAPDSVRFDEAQASSLSEVKKGDMLRALGDKSTDGTGFTAEQVIAGAFQTIAGTVKSIDAAKNEVVIKNLQTNKDVTIVISDTSVLKRFPAEMAERLAGFQMVGAGGGARPVGQGGGQGRPVTVTAPGGQGQTQGQGAGRVGFGGPRPGGGGAGGGIDDMLERFPNITAADLKVGDMIALSSTRNAEVDRIKAIKLLAGVEPFLRAAQAGNGRGRGNGVEAGFSIPGLDGVSFP